MAEEGINGGGTDSASDIIRQRYRQVEREADALGRVIGVRRLNPADQAKITGLTADLNGYDLIPREDGEPPIRLAHRMPLIMAAAVCEIDGNPIAFPKTRGELDAILNRLDTEGLEAVGKAAARLGEAEMALSAKREAAKNLSGIPASDLSVGS
jgi:hypothetical protein